MSVSRALGCGLAKLPAAFAHVRVPIVAAPMFLVSGPELVKASSRAGTQSALPVQLQSCLNTMLSAIVDRHHWNLPCPQPAHL